MFQRAFQMLILVPAASSTASEAPWPSAPPRVSLRSADDPDPGAFDHCPVFTEAESAQNHFQIGNMGLALKLILDSLDETGGRLTADLTE